MAFAEGIEIEAGIAFAGQRHLLSQFRRRRCARQLGEPRVVGTAELDGAVEVPAASLRRGEQDVAPDIEAAEEIGSHADRPDERGGVERQLRLDLVEQLEWMPAFAVELV